MNITYYPNDEEKFIIENFFVYNKINSRSNFFNWLNSTFSQHGISVSASPREVGQFLGDFHFNVIWDKSSQRHMVQHLFSMPNFSVSKSKLKELNKFRFDWYHLDNEGNSLAHYCAKNPKNLIGFSFASKVQNKTGVLLNHAGDSYHTLLLKELKFESIKLDTNYTIFGLIEVITNSIKEFVNNRYFNELPPAKLNQYIDNIEKYHTSLFMLQNEINLNDSWRKNAYERTIKELKNYQHLLNLELQLGAVAKKSRIKI